MLVAEPQSNERHLPPLRDELQLIPGAPLLGGAPSWMIYDPVQSKFYQISIEVFDLLSNWSVGTVAKLVDKYHAISGRSIDEEEVLDTLQFLTSNSLTRDSASGSYKDFAEQRASARKTGLSWIAHNYLFFRIPLVKPSQFLQKSLPMVEPLFSKYFVMLVGIVSLVGLLLVSRQWDVFIGQFSHLFNATGLIVFGFSLMLVKILHELAHAYTATRLGVRVSSMGIAFLVMMPVLYTDTTDAWRLKSSSQRARIDAAGMVVELMIAGLATFLWLFLDDGPVRSAIFALATTGWILSLLINLNPFMRFDGYYLLADSLGIPNLQPRSFALSKWRLRETLFALNEPAPEPNHSMRKWMIIYGYMVWIYRFFLFLGIAFLVYTLFFKVLGVILFVLEIAMFIVAPILKELKVWWSKRSKICRTRRSAYTLGLFALSVTALFIPWSSTVQVPVVLAAKQVTTIYSKHDAIIEGIYVQSGQKVSAQGRLFRLRSPDLEYQLESVQQEIALLRSRQSRGVADKIDRSNALILNQQYEMSLERQAGIERKIDELEIVASFDGIIADLDPDLQPGQWINRNMPLGTLVDHSVNNVRGYVSESNLPRVNQGQDGVFIADNTVIPAIDVNLAMVSMANSETIDMPYLASVYGGNIPVQQDKQTFVPIESEYLVEFELTEDAPEITQALPGVVKVNADSESMATRIWRAVAKVTVREMGV